MYFSLSENYFVQLLQAIKEHFLAEVAVGDIGEQIRESIAYHEVFHIQIGSLTLPFGDTTVGAWITIVMVFFLAYWMGRRFEKIPRGRQIVTEGFVELFMNLCRNQNMNETQAQQVAPFVGSIAVFLCLTNLSSAFRIVPPAKDPVTPITLAFFTVGYVIFTGIKFVGLKGFWGSLTYPKVALVPFRILDYFIKPISLSLRLFGNIFGAFILMEFIYIIMPAIIPGILGIWFDLADGILQAGVFTYLTVVYIGEIIEGAHHSAEQKSDMGMKTKRA
jgi:F-type H+-transporting ATPase subunit a